MDRVGERLLLDALATGQEVIISNNTPHFMRSGRAVGQPLNDPFVSQRPIRFAPAADGGVHVLVERGGTPVYADSWINGSARFTDDDLVQGVVLELAERVVLLLHWFDQQVEE
jgi:two-component system nitrogen regulation response regulator GlnG